jgi:hypothetical protein
MAKCKNNNHQWVMNFVAPKTWIQCICCSERFPAGPEVIGVPYRGPVPFKYQRTES